MDIRFKKVTIDNFLSFGHAEIELDTAGYVLIRGENQNPMDACESNGAGKSTIWSAVCWALTGETIAGVTKVVNLNTEGGCGVTLEFDYDGDEYVISRYREHETYGTDLKIYVNGEDRSGKGIKASSAILAELLPDITSSFIGSVIVLGQGLPSRFTNNTPAKRKEVLEQLSRSDYMIAEIKDKLSETRDYYKDEISNADVESAKATVQRDIYQEQAEKAQADINALGDGSAYRARLYALDIEIKELTDSGKILRDTVEEKDKTLTQKRQELEAVQKTIADKTSENSTETQKLIDAWYTDNADIQKELNDAVSDYKSVDDEIRRIEAIKDVCPTCGRKLDGVEKPDTTDLRERLIGLGERKGKAEQKQHDHQNKYNEIKTEQDKKFKDEIGVLQAQADTLSTECRDGERELTELRKQLDEARNLYTSKTNEKKDIQHEIDTLEDKVTSLKKDKAEKEENIIKLNEKIVYINENKSVLNDRLTATNQMLNIASRDFRGILLANIINFISGRVKDYALCVFGNTQLDFALNGNNIDITYCEKPYENLSGGEKQRVDIIIQFALRDMLCRFSGFSCNCIVLDELFDALDSVSCQRVIDLISTKLSDVETIYIVSHRKDLTIPIDTTITVIKDEKGVSSIKAVN